MPVLLDAAAGVVTLTDTRRTLKLALRLSSPEPLPWPVFDRESQRFRVTDLTNGEVDFARLVVNLGTGACRLLDSLDTELAMRPQVVLVPHRHLIPPDTTRRFTGIDGSVVYAHNVLHRSVPVHPPSATRAAPARPGERPCLCCRKEHQLPPVIDLTDDDAPQDAGADERNEAIDAPPNADGAAVVSSSGSDSKDADPAPAAAEGYSTPVRPPREPMEVPGAPLRPGTRVVVLKGKGKRRRARIAKIAEPLNGRSRAKARTAKKRQRVQLIDPVSDDDSSDDDEDANERPTDPDYKPGDKDVYDEDYRRGGGSKQSA